MASLKILWGYRVATMSSIHEQRYIHSKLYRKAFRHLEARTGRGPRDGRRLGVKYNPF